MTTPALIAGPYTPPVYRIGDSLACAVRGRLTVAGTTDGPIPWPYAAGPGGCRLLIVTPELERAVATESAQAVAYHWSIDRKVVSEWRKALAVGRRTEGTRRRYAELAGGRLDSSLGGFAHAVAERQLLVLSGPASGPYLPRQKDSATLARLGWDRCAAVTSNDLPLLVRAAIRVGVSVAIRPEPRSRS
jgi:hypothetical protein